MPSEIARASSGKIGAADLQAFFDRVIPEQLASLHIAGAVVSVVAGDDLVFAKGYGYADVKNQIEIQPDTTLFRIGSITKLFTWTAVMQLVEQGKLDLDTNVNSYLDFQIPDTYLQPITLRHLMTHTAGFEDRAAGVLAATPEGMIPNGQWVASHIPARVRAPGEFSSYSNYGVALAGYIVERVSSIPFADYIEARILTPLGMNHTTSRQPLPVGLAANMSKGYSNAGDKFLEQDFEYIIPAPMGGAASTATDMARFMVAYLQNGRSGDARILQETTVEQMLTRQFGQDPRLNGWDYGFYEMSRKELRVTGHEGDTSLFHSLLAIIPEKNLGIFIAYNSQNAMNVQNLLLNDFLDEFFPAAAPNAVKQTLSPAELARFAGSYRQNSQYAYTTVEKALTLFNPIIVQPTNGGALQLSSLSLGSYRFIPVEPLLFAQEDDADNVLLFRADANGNITHAFAKNYPGAVFEKLPWYADFSLHYGILSICFLLFLSTLFIAPARWLIRRIRKQMIPLPRLALIGRWVLIMLSIAGILFPVGFTFAIGGIVYSKMDFLNIVLTLPIFFIVLTLTAIFFNYLAWRAKYWYVAERIHYTLVTLAAMSYVWFLFYWNLIGWKY